jgi:hypothetical protein
MHARGLLPSLLAALHLLVAAPVPAQGVKPYQRPPDRANMTVDQKKAETFVAKLYGRAQAAAAVANFKEAIEAYEDALKALEGAYGPNHLRLTEVLDDLVLIRFNQNIGTKTGLAQQERIVQILGMHGDKVALADRVGTLIQLGDVYLYMDDARAMEPYRQAWQLQAKAKSAESADALFGATTRVRLRMPPNPRNHKDWDVNVVYDVDATGKATVTEITGDAKESLVNDVRRAYADARFRPRLVGGEPVATTGVTFTHKYPSTYRP